MTTDVQQTYVMIPISKITSKLSVRRINKAGLKRILESMKRSRFLDNFPLIVLLLPDGTYLLIDGNHRYEAAKEAGINVVPCVVKTKLTEQEQYKLALESNNAAETVVPSTMVTNAEFVWARTGEGKTQEKIAGMMGWSRDKVAKYELLRKIDKDAWSVIVTVFEPPVTITEEEGVTAIVTPVTITETLLRSILELEVQQQLELVTEFVHPDKDKRISKGKFTERAKAYLARNEMRDYASPKLGDLGDDFTSRLIEAVYSGAYDKDWKDFSEHPKLHKLIQSLKDEWEQKNSIHLVHGDFYEEVKKIGDSSIDLVLTDPPYNIARENVFQLEGRSNISQDFGKWDKYLPKDFIALFDIWGREWARILRDQGSGYVFTSDSYISYLRVALEQAGLHVKATIVWHKTNPGTQKVKTNFTSSIEYILFFTKGEGGHTFNWQGENEMHNHIETSICAGNERIDDAKGNTLHPTQKPETVIKHLMSISSNRGETVFDGFMGVGSTGKVAKNVGRKFIGIEQDKAFFDAAQRRLAE